MELNTISGLAIAGVICSVVLSMGVPIALFIAGRVKLKARISSFFIGAGTYLLFAMLLDKSNSRNERKNVIRPEKYPFPYAIIRIAAKILIPENRKPSP